MPGIGAAAGGARGVVERRHDRCRCDDVGSQRGPALDCAAGHG